jgi:hypothetical protein
MTESEAQQDPARLRAIVGACGLVAILATAVWVGGARSHRQAITPDDASLQAAADSMAQEVLAADAIAFVPGWSASQPWRFAEVWRNKGLDFDKALDLGDPIDLWDVDSFQRLWIVTTHDRSRTLHLPKSAKLLHGRDFGHGTGVDLYALPASRIVLDLRAHLAEAVVERQDDKNAFAPCTWTGDKFDCGGSDAWKTVFAFDNEVGTGRRKCIFVSPTRDGGITRLTWKAHGAARELAGHFGLRMWGVRVDEGSDLTMRVFAGDRLLYTKSVARGDFTWYPWTVPLTPVDRGHDIRFEFTADKIAWRQGCFDARLLGAPKD